MIQTQTTLQAFKTLRDAGYCVENLPHISDVLDVCHCTSSEAMALLDDMSEEAYGEDRINDFAELYEYVIKEDGLKDIFTFYSTDI